MMPLSASGMARAARATGSPRAIGRAHRFVRRLAAALIAAALIAAAIPAEAPALAHRPTEPSAAWGVTIL